MTKPVDDLVAKRNSLEATILALLGEFEQQTGLNVVKIDVRRIDLVSIESRRSMLDVVRVDTELPY